MEVRLLLGFRAVAARLNFHRAAEDLRLSQPALSRQVARLEEMIGTPLFHREKRRVTLTPAGEYVWRRSDDWLEQAAVMLRETREVARGERGQLTIGYTEAAMAGFLPGLLARLRKKSTGLALVLRLDHSEALVRQVGQGGLDVAFTSSPGGDKALESREVAREEIGVVLPHEHPLARSPGRIALSALGKEKFILFPARDNPQLHTDIMAACQRAGFLPEVVEEAGTRALAVNLVAAGTGVTFLSERSAHLCGTGTAFKLLRGRDRPWMRFYMVHATPGHNHLLALTRIRSPSTTIKKQD